MNVEFLVENFSSVTKNGRKYMIAPTNGKYRVYTKSLGDAQYRARDFEDLESAKRHGENHIAGSQSVVEAVVSRLDEVDKGTLERAFAKAKLQNSTAKLTGKKTHNPMKFFDAIRKSSPSKERKADPFSSVIGFSPTIGDYDGKDDKNVY